MVSLWCLVLEGLCETEQTMQLMEVPWLEYCAAVVLPEDWNLCCVDCFWAGPWPERFGWLGQIRWAWVSVSLVLLLLVLALGADLSWSMLKLELELC